MLYFYKKIKKNTWRYHYFTFVYQKSWWYGLQFLRHRVWWTEIGNYGSFFALKPRKIIILKKWDILLEIWPFYTCVPQMTIMMYGSRDTEHERQNFLSFWAIFCPFSPLTTCKIKILKKWQKFQEILSFYHKCVP